MSRQNLSERAAVIALSELSGKVSVRHAREHLRSRGLLPNSADLVEEGELDFTRRMFQATRKYGDSEEAGRLRFINLFERAEDGSKVEYYRKAEETSLDEAVQHLEYWNRCRRTSEQRLRYWFKLFSQIHGKRKLQRRLTFDIPDDSRAGIGK